MKRILAWIGCFFAIMALLLPGAPLAAAEFDQLLSENGDVTQVDSTADTYEYVGANVIARGHVVIRFGTLLLTADKSIYNLESKDAELSGNVTFAARVTTVQDLTLEAYEKAISDPYQITRRLDVVTTETGGKRIRVEITRNAMFLQAERAFINFSSGVIQFRNFKMKNGITYSEGKEAERLPDGTMVVRDSRMTTCNYLMDDHAHYAVSAKRAVMKPPRQNSGLVNYKGDFGDTTIIAEHTFLELWDVPVLWFPFLYKPAEDGSFGGKIEIGNNSDFGYYIRTTKNIRILEEPYLNANVMLDGYSKRGFGYGVSLDMLTPESGTELFFYGINDHSPYEYWGGGSDSDWKKAISRMDIPKYRYEFHLSNVTHLTPRTDFRTQIDLLSDFNFLNDYFNKRYEEVLEPPTFVALERQFDRMTATLYTPIRVNDFFSTVQRLPETRFDFQRQELFGGLYYQGETTFGYYDMQWRDFDRDRLLGNRVEPRDYDTFRFDSLHMFYYPFKIWNINFIPRAGIRMTAYSKTSERGLGTDELSAMFMADDLDGEPVVDVFNYDDDGGSKFRVAGEIGLEVNTKFYRTWQDVKSDYFGIDGLRHVAVPYVNYTFIPNPNVSADHLYYFDEVDRIDETHFVRLGLVNRLQTRRGGKIHEWMSLENYWDYFIYASDGFNHIGDLGTILRINPTNDITISSELLLDLGGSNEHDSRVYRGLREAGRPGLDCDFINRWYTKISWRFAPQWRVYFGYLYSDDYVQRSAYSMGSTLSGVNATSLMYSQLTRGQYLTGGLEFPVIFDPKTSGYIQFAYDVDAALMKNVGIGVKRDFHCWQLQLEVGRDCDRGGSDYDKEYDYYFSFFVSLTAMPDVQLGHKLEP